MEEIRGYKVFNPDWTCSPNGNTKQYACPGKYEEDITPIRCGRGMHFCRKAADCFNYYTFDSNNKVAEVIAYGDIAEEGNKCCTNKLEIVRELTWHEVLELVNTGKDCTGLCNSGNRNSGDWNSGDWNSGDWNKSSSIIQNDEAKRTKFVLQMQPENVILLSGTPTSGKYENLWSQAQLLGWKISKKAFNAQYVNWKKIDVGGFPMWIVDKDEPYKNVERLKQKLREHGAIFMKSEDVFDLPEQTFIEVKCNTTKEYRKFQRTSLVKVPGTAWVEDPAESDFYGTAYTKEMIELIGDTTLTKRLYSRQLCGQYNPDKIQAFKDLVTSTNDRLIVFYNFDAELELLKKVAASLNRPVSEINGHVKDKSNYNTEDNSITLVQYQAGARGENLQKANKIIYFTLPTESELFEQSKKRIHRIGQTNACFYYLLICRNSVEEKVYATLKMRKDFTDELFAEYEKESC